MNTEIIYNDGYMKLPFLRGYADKAIKRHARFIASMALRRGKYISSIMPESFYVRIEVTNACNYRCKFCPHLNMDRNIGIMDNKLYQKIIDECHKIGIRMVNLTSFGESLLDKELLFKIRYAKERGIPYVYLTTNGSLLDKEKAEEIIKLGLDEIRFSIDSVSPAVYSEIRDEYNYDTVVNNIEALIGLKKQFKRDKPRITVCFIKRGDDSEVEAFINSWKNRVDTIHIQSFHNWAGGIADAREVVYIPCKRLWFTFNIFWNGSISLCCADTEGKVILGNVKESSILDIWNNDMYQIVRKKNLDGDCNFICARCTLPQRDSLLWMKKLFI